MNKKALLIFVAFNWKTLLINEGIE